MRLLSILIFFSSSIFASETLTEQLDSRRKASMKKRTTEVAKIMHEGNEEVKKMSLHKSLPNVGDPFPDIEMTKKDKSKVSIREYWKDGYAVIKFYRGHWCPYCQIELKAYQDEIEKFNSLKAKIVVLTPDVYRYIDKTKRRFKLDFDIFQDKDNLIGKKLGIVFKLNQKVGGLYKKFKIDLNDSQGNSDKELPLPATYVVNQKGEVIYKFADADYTLRADPLEVIAAIKKIEQK